jgi:hypothetical protein
MAHPTERPHLVPIAKIDHAVRIVQRYGTAEECAALSAADNLDRHASRQVIISTAERVKSRHE